MPELKEQLQRTFGDNYSLERELGNGVLTFSQDKSYSYGVSFTRSPTP
jgi:hypothetical protein